MELGELKVKSLNAVFWNLSGTLLKQGISFIISLFLARLLTPADFGIVGMATVFITFTQGFSDLGLSSALIQTKQPTQEQYSSVFFFNLFTSSLLALILWISSGLIAQFYANPSVKPIVQFISYSFIINSLTSVQWSILYKNLDVKKTRLANLLSSIIGGCAGIIMAFNGFGVWSMIYSGFIGSCISVIMIWYYSGWRPSFHFSFSAIKGLFPFGFRVFLINYMQEVYEKIDVLIIGKLFNPYTLGLYFRATSFNQLITKYTSQSLSGVFFPVISNLQHDLEEIKRVFTKTLHTVCFLSFMLSGILYVSAEPLIVILFTAKWYPAVHYFKILVFSSYVLPMTLLFNGVLLGTGNARKQLRLEVWKKALGVLGILIGFLFGINGYLWALALTSTAGLMLSLYFIDTTINLNVKSSLKCIYVYALPMCLGMFASSFTNQFTTNLLLKLVLNSCCFLVCYLTVCNLFNIKGLHFTFRLIISFIPPP